MRIRLLGRYQVYPALAAVTVALEEGLPLDEVLPRIEAVEAERGRMAMMPLENGAIVVRDEFKSAIETVDAALDVLTEIPARRRIVVLGEVAEAPGSQGPIYRRLGGRLAESADRAILLGEGNSCRSYVVGAKRASMVPKALIEAKHSLRRAVEALRHDLERGDVVLVKGRMEQHLERVALALRPRALRAVPVCPSAELRTLARRSRGSGPPI